MTSLHLSCSLLGTSLRQGELGEILPLPFVSQHPVYCLGSHPLFLMHLLFLHRGRRSRRKPVHKANALSTQQGEFLISTSAFLCQLRASTEMGPRSPHHGRMATSEGLFQQLAALSSCLAFKQNWLQVSKLKEKNEEGNSAPLLYIHRFFWFSGLCRIKAC